MLPNMLVYLQKITSDLSSLLESFASSNNLPHCTVQNNNKIVTNVITSKVDDDDDTNKIATHSIALKWQLKSSEKQPFDIRLSFQSPALKAWWPKLNQLSQEMLSLKQCPVASATLLEGTHTLDIRLDRKKALVGLLSNLKSGPIPPSPLKSITKSAIVLKVPSIKSAKNHLGGLRIDLVCNAVENLLKHFDTSIVDSNLDVSSLKSSPQECHQDGDEIRSNADERISVNCISGEEQTKNDRTSANYYCDLLSSHLLNFQKINHLHIILVVAESELTKVQTGVELWKRGNHWAASTFSFKIIKVASVNITSSSSDYKEQLLQKEEEGPVNEENEKTILKTSLAVHLLSPPLHNPITKAPSEDTRAEAAFLQYNIARINSILQKYKTEYLSKFSQTAQANLEHLTNDEEWNLILLHLLRMQQLTADLYDQLLLTTNANDDCTTFHIHKVIRLMNKLARCFSIYYRNVKILLLPSAELDFHEHLLPLIAARVHFCALLRQHLASCLALLNIETVQTM